MKLKALRATVLVTRLGLQQHLLSTCCPPLHSVPSPFSVPDDPCTYWKCQEAAARVGHRSGMDGGRDEEHIRFTGSVRPDLAFELTVRTDRLAENTKEKAQRSVGRSVGWGLTLRQRRAG